MLLKLYTVCCLVFFLVAIVTIDVEAKLKNHTRHKNSSRWKEYKKKLNLTIAQEELDQIKFEHWEEHDKFIKEFNSNPNHPAKLGHNEFSHLTDDEINKLKGLKISGSLIRKREVGGAIRWSTFNGAVINIPVNSFVSTPGYTLPASVDWTQRGFNTPVRNQNQCGNCWAFAATAALEASILINLKANLTLSVQQLTDCAYGNLWGNSGCNGGSSITAYNYIFNNSICTEDTYPFTFKQGTCSYSGASDTKHWNLFRASQIYLSQQGNDNALMELLDKYGPVTIAFDSSSPIFNSYAGGIYNSPSSQAFPYCSTTLNHAMLLVGYGVDNASGEPFWLIKNSWGPTWGINGYIKVSRKVVNNCGISSWGVLPVAALGSTNPSTIPITTTPPKTTAGASTNLICDNKIRADPGCKTGYSCFLRTSNSTCIGGMWSAASSTATCGPSYTSCQSLATWTGCLSQGIFLTAKCSQRITCTLVISNYTAPNGYLIDETIPAYRSGWTCPK